MNFSSTLFSSAMALVLISGAPTVIAQTATDFNEGMQVVSETTQGVVSVKWWGRAGRTYFVQTSEDLTHWTYLPLIEPGANQPISWDFSSNGGVLFWRLRYANMSPSNVFNADFDGDGVSNWDELQRGTDPLSDVVDGNNDGIPDDWELLYFNTTNVNLGGDDDADGVTNQQEYLNGTHPKIKDNPILKLQVNVIVQ